VLGYHGCDRTVGERVLRGEPFIGSNNEYDWLGPGTYFWEANPQRGLEFAAEAAGRKHTDIKDPFVIVKGVFTEGKPVYPGAGFDEKTHVQIAVCNPLCIKGAFRVPPHQIVSPGP